MKVMISQISGCLDYKELVQGLWECPCIYTNLNDLKMERVDDPSLPQILQFKVMS